MLRSASSPLAWLMAPSRKTITVGVADMVALNDAQADLVTHSLGSCLGVTAYDPQAKVGGLLRVMLPDSKIDPAKAVSKPCMFVDTGLPRLFQAVDGLGGDKSRLIIKVAGGAQFPEEHMIFSIGSHNVTSLLTSLTRHRVTPHALVVRGQTSRTLRLRLSDGQVTVQSPGQKAFVI
jgi:chemotaxis protein CheD